MTTIPIRAATGRQPNERIHFLHLGKTGGTAIKAALGPYASDFNLVLHEHGTTLADVPLGERFFFAVRDPVDRFVSGFHSRQRMGQPRYRSPWSPHEERAFARFTSPDSLASALSAPSRLTRRRARAAMESIQHVKDSYWSWFGSATELARREVDIVHILFQDNLARDFSVLCRLLDMPSIPLPDDDVGAHRNPADLDRTLSERARLNLQDWYASDKAFVLACRSIVTRRQSLLGGTNV